MNMLSKKYADMSQVAKAGFWFAICNCVSSGITFLSLPFFTRLMPSDQYGLVTMYNSWLQLFAVFATLNLNAGAFNNGMVHFPETRDRYSSSMQGLIFATTAVTGVAVFSMTLLFPGVVGLPCEYIPILFVQIFANGIYALWCARQRYEYNYKKLLLMTFVYAVCVTVVAVVAVWLTPSDDFKATIKVLSSSLGSLAVAVILIVVTQHRMLKPVYLPSWKYALWFSVPLIPHYLSLIILGQIDRIMIGNMIGESAAAYYAVAYQISLALSVISNALNSSMVPWQFEKIKRDDYDGLSTRVTQFVGIISMSALLVAFIAPEILLIAAPAEYQEAAVVIPPVVMSIVFTFIYNILSNYEFYFEANKFISIASSVAAVTNIILNLLAIPEFGYIAAAYTTVACYGLLAIAHTLFSWKVCVKSVGVENARKMLNPKQVWNIAFGIFILLLLCAATYSCWPIRALFVVTTGAVLLINSKRLMACLKG